MMGYRASLKWLIANDDCWWLEDPYGIPSVSASLIADIYRKSDEKVTADLLKIWRTYHPSES